MLSVTSGFLRNSRILQICSNTPAVVNLGSRGPIRILAVESGHRIGQRIFFSSPSARSKSQSKPQETVKTTLDLAEENALRKALRSVLPNSRFAISDRFVFDNRAPDILEEENKRFAKLSKPVEDFEQIPGPARYPIVGSFPGFMKRSANLKELPGMHVSSYREFGSIYEYDLFGEKQVFTCNPYDYRLMYQAEGRYPPGGAEMIWIAKKWAKESNFELLTNLLSRGPKWKEARSHVQKDFLLPKVARSYVPLIEEAMQRSSQHFDAFEKHPDHFCTCAAFDMFSAMFFGLQLETTAELKEKGANFNLLDYKSLRNESQSLEFIEATKLTFDYMGKTLMRPWLKMPIFSNNASVKDYFMKSDRMIEIAADLSTTMLKKYDKENKFLGFELESTTSAKGGCPVTGFGAKSGGGSGGQEVGSEQDHSTSIDFNLAKELEEMELSDSECLPYLMRLLQKGDLSLEQVRQNVVFLLSAGVDTTRTTLGWLVIALAQNRRVQDKLRQELDTTLGDEPLTQLSITKLPYLNKVMREAHRMYPPTYVMTQRTAPADLEFDNGRYLVKKGTPVGFNTYAWQNDPQYVDNAEEFRPERWDAEEVAKRKGTPSEVLDHKLLSTPFSFGARMCLGGRVAQVEMISFLARVVREWEFTFENPNATYTPIQPLMTVPDVFPALKIRKIKAD